MARELVSDALWNAVKKFIPPPKAKPRGGRPDADARLCLVGILFVLHTGAAWNAMPAELAAASPATCWRRHKEWTHAGVWDEIWKAALAFLNRRGEVDLSVAIADSASVRAVFGGDTPAPTRQIAASLAASAI
jgi:transposase